MRCFLAVHCPPGVRDRLRAAQERIRPLGDLKPVEYENLHVTLKFLGEAGEEVVEAAKEALSSVGAARFEARAAGLGAFPTPQAARVVWAGVPGGFDELVRLNGAVDSALGPLGFPPQERFHPHITLARARGRVDARGLRLLLDEAAESDFGSWRVERFALMESRLSPKGPAYAELAGFPLR